MTNENSNSVSGSAESSEAQSSRLEGANEEIQILLQTARESIKAVDEMKQKIESYATELTSLKESAEKNAEVAQTAQASAEQAARETEDKKTAINGFYADSKKFRDDVINLVELIKKDSANTKMIADMAGEKDSRVNEYQKELQDLSTECHQLAEQIEDLLPGATSAGLASAFKTRKDAFIPPKKWWAIFHVISVLAIVGVGVFVLLFGKEITSITELILYAIKRSPILAGIILLEEFFRRNYNIALRLEEDYGYKEVLSRSFEGYKKQMEGIQQDSPTAVSTLSTNLLRSMAEQPGRLIDKEKPIKAPPADLIEQLGKMIRDFQEKNK